MNKRVVEVLDETPDSQHVRIRNLYEPIFIRLWEIAEPGVAHYKTDIIHDALVLGQSRPGDKFLWGWRTTGTDIFNIRNIPSIANTMSHIAQMTNPLENYYLIEVTKVRRFGNADGYVTWINAQNLDHLKRVILDNLPD